MKKYLPVLVPRPMRLWVIIAAFELGCAIWEAVDGSWGLAGVYVINGSWLLAFPLMQHAQSYRSGYRTSRHYFTMRGFEANKRGMTLFEFLSSEVEAQSIDFMGEKKYNKMIAHSEREG